MDIISQNKIKCIFPDCHMNKAHWLIVTLDETMDDEKIHVLVNMSYELTNGRG